MKRIEKNLPNKTFRILEKNMRFKTPTFFRRRKQRA